MGEKSKLMGRRNDLRGKRGSNGCRSEGTPINHSDIHQVGLHVGPVSLRDTRGTYMLIKTGSLTSANKQTEL